MHSRLKVQSCRLALILFVIAGFTTSRVGAGALQNKIDAPAEGPVCYVGVYVTPLSDIVTSEIKFRRYQLALAKQDLIEALRQMAGVENLKIIETDDDTVADVQILLTFSPKSGKGEGIWYREGDGPHDIRRLNAYYENLPTTPENKALMQSKGWTLQPNPLSTDDVVQAVRLWRAHGSHSSTSKFRQQRPKDLNSPDSQNAEISTRETAIFHKLRFGVILGAQINVCQTDHGFRWNQSNPDDECFVDHSDYKPHPFNDFKTLGLLKSWESDVSESSNYVIVLIPAGATDDALGTVEGVLLNYGIDEAGRILSDLKAKYGEATSCEKLDARTGLGIVVDKLNCEWMTSWGAVRFIAPSDKIDRMLVMASSRKRLEYEAEQRRLERDKNKSEF